MRRWPLLGFIVLVCCASMPLLRGPEYHTSRANAHIYLTQQAKTSLDSMWLWSKANELETAACIAKADYNMVTDSVTGDVSFWIAGIIPAEIKLRLPTMVYWAGHELCGDTLPSVHTHWLDASRDRCPNCTRWIPSSVDIKTAMERPLIPFHLLVADTGYYLPYRVQP